MDKSVDSIGSCSLDVDADSSEKSDTSGSLNFPTPISIKDITRDFVANINERCAVRKVETTVTLVDTNSTHVQTISTQPSCNLTSQSALNSIATEVINEKKPSYLNLACCVNGYSNITTYDSKIRQDINKSREVSPIRPSTSSLQYCKKTELLAPPKLQTMPKTDIKYNSTVSMKTTTHAFENGHHALAEEQNEVKNTSFIQQQMERLYGPAALAQVFYSPKKMRITNTPRVEDNSNSELKLKFKELSPRKDYSEFRKKINGTSSQPVHASELLTVESTNVENNNIDLPVLRHLSPEFKKNFEFRAQTSKMSPKRNFQRGPATEDECADSLKNANDNHTHAADEVDHKNISAFEELSLENETIKSELEISIIPIKTNSMHISETQIKITEGNSSEKNGHYFLKLFKAEKERLLSLVADVEAHIQNLSNNTDIDEEILGKLRTASGKAELLVNSKMKQFEGLCYKNLNDIPGVQFPTTSDDLQGFWDMVNLQIDECNSKFTEIEKLKANNWKKQDEVDSAITPNKQQKSNKPISATKSNKSNGSMKSQMQSAAALERESKRKEFLKKMRQKNMASAGDASGLEHQSHVIAQGPTEIFINENNS